MNREREEPYCYCGKGREALRIYRRKWMAAR